MKKLVLLAPMFFLMSCALSRPLSGPGYNKELNKIEGDPNRTVVIAITNALLDRSKRGPFDKKTQALYKNLDKYEGYIAGSIRLKILGKEVWTYTVWENESALMKFVKSEEHKEAVRSTGVAIEKIRSLNTSLLAKDVPLSWDKVEEIIKQKEMKAYIPRQRLDKK